METEVWMVILTFWDNSDNFNDTIWTWAGGLKHNNIGTAVCGDASYIGTEVYSEPMDNQNQSPSGYTPILGDHSINLGPE